METTPTSVDSRVRAWETEISNYFFRGGKAQVNANQLPLICHDRLHEFDTQSDSLKRILVGGKGTGKSTALARKAVQLLDNKHVVIPNFHPYVVRIETLVLDQNVDDVYPDVHSHYCWVQIWKLVLGTVFIADAQWSKVRDQKFGQHLGCVAGKAEDEFFERVGERVALAGKGRREPVSTVLQLILERHYDTNQCQQWFSRYIRSRLPSAGDGPYVMLIDQIDEALSRFRELSAAGQGQSVWEAAQTAIVDAIAEIGSLTSQSLQVFAAIRTEAFRHYQDYGARTQAQVASICLDLTYTRPAMEEIFLQNIRLTDKDSLAVPEDTDLIKRFLGTVEYPHPYVRNASEPAIQWLARHTFGSPRELVMHGNQISKCDRKSRSNRQQLAKIVNETGVLILNDYISELVPLWNDTVEAVYPYLKHNLISRDEVKCIEEKLKESLKFAPIEYLYQCGMIGVPTSVDTEHAVQEFVPLSTPSVSLELPDADFYVIHPCLYPRILNRLRQSERGGFHSHIFVPGDGLPCPRRIDRPRIYLLIDRTNQCIQVSVLDAATSWNPPLESVREAICPALTVTQEANVGPVLLVAMLMAMSNRRSNYPRVDDICEVVAHLVDEGFCARVFGKRNNRLPAVDYFREQLMYEEGRQTHPVSDLRKILEGVDETFGLHVKSAMTRVESLSVGGLKWTEIRVLGE